MNGDEHASASFPTSQVLCRSITPIVSQGLGKCTLNHKVRIVGQDFPKYTWLGIHTGELSQEKNEKDLRFILDPLFNSQACQPNLRPLCIAKIRVSPGKLKAGTRSSRRVPAKTAKAAVKKVPNEKLRRLSSNPNALLKNEIGNPLLSVRQLQTGVGA